MTSHRTGTSALDQFLPESVFAAELPRIEAYVAPGDVQLDPIEEIARASAPENSSRVQPWPMVAAALVAIGVSMLAMAAFARFDVSPL